MNGKISFDQGNRPEQLREGLCVNIKARFNFK